MQCKKYWDARSLEANFQIPFDVKVLDSLGVLKNSRILDAGCSYGRTLKSLCEEGFPNLTGLDYSDGMIERGKQECPDFDFVRASVTEIPLEDESFDVVINLGLVNHLVEDRDLVKCINEFARVLTPGGFCLITDYSYGTSKFDVDRYLEYLPEFGHYGMIEINGRQFHHRSHEMLVSMAGNNFDFVSVKHSPFPTKRGHKRECYQLILRKK